MKLTALFISLVLLTTTASSQQLYKIKECVIEKGVLKIVEVDYNPANGERTITVNGVTKNFTMFIRRMVKNTPQKLVGISITKQCPIKLQSS